jgi:hypothetical protein
MLHNDQILCENEDEFKAGIEHAIELCLATDKPIRASAHRGPLKDDEGPGGIMFSVEEKPSVLFSVRTTYNITDEVFTFGIEIADRLRLAGMLVGFRDWEESTVTHILTRNQWEYGMIASDAEAILHLAKFGGTLRRSRRPRAISS